MAYLPTFTYISLIFMVNVGKFPYIDAMGYHTIIQVPFQVEVASPHVRSRRAGVSWMRLKRAPF